MPNPVTDQWGVRTYYWRDAPLLSVTSLRSLCGMAMPLVGWIKSQIARTAVDRIDDLVIEVSKDPEEARKWLQREADVLRDKTADLGKAVHQAIAERIDPGTLTDPQMAGMVRMGYEAHKRLGLTIVSSEKKVFNLRHGYAGQYDAIAADPTGKTWLVDYKSGKGAYTDAAIQLLLYRLCGSVDDEGFVGYDDTIDEAATALLKSVTGLAILHVRQNGYEWIPISLHGTAGARLRQAALAMALFAQWLHRHPSIADVAVPVDITNNVEGFVAFGTME